MDERKELARRLRQMAVTTGDLSCLGCGYERGCSVHGCAVLKRAADILDPAVDINRPVPLEELQAAAAEPACKALGAGSPPSFGAAGAALRRLVPRAAAGGQRDD